MTLEHLKEIGAVSIKLDAVNSLKKDLITISDFLQLSEEEQKTCKQAVVVDDPEWVATTKRRPVKEASAVYSCNGDNIGCWKKDKGYSFLRLVGSSLAVTKRVEIKKETEERNMANLESLTKEMNDFNTDALDQEVAASPVEKKDGKKKELSVSEKAAADVKLTLAGVSVGNNDANIVNNRKYGRLMFFLTNSDSSMKVAMKKVAMKDSAGNYIKRDNLTEEENKQWEDAKNDPKKKIPANLCEKQTDLVWRNARPGGIVGVVVKTPVGSEVSLTRLKGSSQMSIDADNTLAVRVWGKETAFAYLAANYGDKIQEDESIVGPTASTIEVKFAVRPDKNGVNKLRQSYGLLKGDTKKRKSVLCETNYFPVKMYQTIAASDTSAEAVKTKNLLFEAMFKDAAKYEKLSAEAKAAVTENNGEFESVWFNKGQVIDVVKYDAESENDKVVDVRIPAKMKKETTKDGKTNVTYPFLYTKLGEANGPQEKYAHLIKATKMTEEEFIKKVEAVTKSAGRKSGGGKNGPAFTPENYLQALFGGHEVVTNTGVNFMDLAEAIEKEM